MSLWSPAARDAFRARLAPKAPPRTEQPPKQVDTEGTSDHPHAGYTEIS